MTHEIAFLTCHQKETVVAPILEKQGFAVRVETSFDTDTLGTFTGETPRPASMRDTARRKARIGMKASGQTIGIARLLRS